MTRHALPYLAVAHVTGPDAAEFLHAQLSADVNGIDEGAGVLACYCSPRGQVYGLLLVVRRDTDFLLAGAAALLPAILKRLRLFVLRARVELTLADGCAVYGLDDAADAIAGDATATVAGLNYALAADGDSGLVSDTSVEGWKASELRHGVAWLAPATGERFIPQMLGFDGLGAVSFTKGCYPGQEIIARARYLGKVKRKPLRLLLEDAEAAQNLTEDALAAGGELTLVTDAARTEATLIDHAAEQGTGRVLLFVVAPGSEAPVQSVAIGGQDYRCATM